MLFSRKGKLLPFSRLNGLRLDHSQLGEEKHMTFTSQCGSSNIGMSSIVDIAIRIGLTLQMCTSIPTRAPSLVEPRLGHLWMEN